jgi:uncharacterized protein (TIGR03083 family)
MSDIATAYAEGRQRISDLVRDLDPARADMVVPACPEWSVKDVTSHITGVCTDILAGNIGGAATDEWTAAQVAARRDTPIADVVAEWDDSGAQIEAMLGEFPQDAATQMVTDLATHEHDLRGTLGVPGARDSLGVDLGVDFLATYFIATAQELDSPPLRISADGRSWSTTEGVAAMHLNAPPFELMRALSGRRSIDQLRQLDWSGDPEPFLPLFTWFVFKPAADDLVE